MDITTLEPGSPVRVWSLHSDTQGGFLDGEDATFLGMAPDGQARIEVTRNMSGEYQLDADYRVWPEQLFPPGEHPRPAPFKAGEVVRIYSSQGFFYRPVARGVMGVVRQDQRQGSSVIVRTLVRNEKGDFLTGSFEVYAMQAHRVGVELGEEASRLLAAMAHVLHEAEAADHTLARVRLPAGMAG